MLIYENAQWIVDDEGMHFRGASLDYNIFYDRLLEARETVEGPVYDWLVHLAEKDGIKVTQLIDAFRQALRYHLRRESNEFHVSLFARSAQEAINVASQRRENC